MQQALIVTIFTRERGVRLAGGAPDACTAQGPRAAAAPGGNDVRRGT